VVSFTNEARVLALVSVILKLQCVVYHYQQLELPEEEANYTVSGHSKSRRKIDDFGPDQKALLSERF
jgi:hypothetical protein